MEVLARLTRMTTNCTPSRSRSTIGEDTNTYIFFSADNGYHMGDYSFLPGKMTPFDTDIKVPLVVVGPGVLHQTVHEIAQNIDLCPTFTELGGHAAPTAPDGHSLVPLLHGQTPPVWRHMALIEHHGPPDGPTDPDNQPHASGHANPPDYEALRTEQYLYVEYSNDGVHVSEYAYYDVTSGHDPHELKNIFTSLSSVQQDALHTTLDKNKTCGEPSKPTCWRTQQ